MSEIDIEKVIAEIRADGPGKPRLARDPVNQAMINNWVEALENHNPIYVDEAAAREAGHPGIVAPPAMAQVWTMIGLKGVPAEDDSWNRAIKAMIEAGYTGLVATNCEQIYHRYVRPGEQLAMTTELGEPIGPKKTALGEGYFLNQHIVWRVGDEIVTEMKLRVLRFKPRDSHDDQESARSIPEDLDPSILMRPAVSRDTQFFWDGIACHEIRIQRRPDGSLQHPPVPAIWGDKSAETDYLVASGRGTIFTFTVHHGPKVRGRTLPFIVAVVELEEGVRMVGELRNADPARVSIGMPVRTTFLDLPPDESGPAWTLYAWEPA
ncbi:DNA-binding protein [Mycobacterium malmoense]|uniref:bifunctional MaoC family dehydratase N-terminal/OB-fold nucleic acid binding domain-containing protein n=1 Tax=Mycobacterium malmoense TaxID=1780 RepID=UPI00080B0311|nr:OB-fold domain-containing protein [Mycobacterium malmoense]OCB30175.1 DNA-binding protein [Mycobacterium malmoense]